jgi:transcription elongation factor Elf1
MFDKIDKIIMEKKLTPPDCTYHTLRGLENKGKVRILVVKGDTKAHIEIICPFCGKYNYIVQDYKPVSKAAKIRFVVICPGCGKKTKVEKLKGKK